MIEKDTSLILKLEGGVADEGLLDLYDAANTLYGLARATNMTTHAFSNKEEVKKKNKNSTGARAFVHSSRKGCFEEQVDIVFDENIKKKIGPSVISKVFWDYLAWTWSHALGIGVEPETAQVKKIARKNDLFIYEMADALETPMLWLHRAMVRNKDITVYVNRPHVGDILTLNGDTFDFVSTRHEQTETEYIPGNVTRVNVLSQFGRLFSDEERRVVSFELANPDDKRVIGLALKSMQEHNEGRDGKVNLKVSKVVSAQGVVKRYIVHDILEIL